MCLCSNIQTNYFLLISGEITKLDIHVFQEKSDFFLCSRFSYVYNLFFFIIWMHSDSNRLDVLFLLYFCFSLICVYHHDMRWPDFTVLHALFMIFHVLNAYYVVNISWAGRMLLITSLLLGKKIPAIPLYQTLSFMCFSQTVFGQK